MNLYELDYKEKGRRKYLVFTAATAVTASEHAEKMSRDKEWEFLSLKFLLPLELPMDSQ